MKKPHIHLEKNDSYARAVVCGSPERAEKFAAMLEGAKSVAKNREYHSYLGKHQGKEILIMSHGVGSAGAAICFQELIDVGAKAVIRIGTAGGLTDDAKIGDIVVASSAVRKDGVSAQMIPIQFPAVADFELTGKILSSMKGKGGQARFGTIVTSDLFYPGLIDNELALYRDAGAVAVEMEVATLFVIAQLRKIKAGAMVVLDGNPLKWKEGDYDPRPERLAQSVEKCFQAAVDALTSAL